MPDVLFNNFGYLLEGALQTVLIAGSGIAIGTVLGMVLGTVAELSPKLITAIINVYVFVVRGVPILIWMFLAYYMLPTVGVHVDDRIAVTGALVVYAASFVVEITRGALRSISHTQVEAAKALGLRTVQILRLIVVPQAVKVSVPPLLNNSVIMVKQSAYVSVVGVWELTYAAREVVEREIAPFQIFIGVMLLYFAICYPLSVLASWGEKRYAYDE